MSIILFMEIQYFLTDLERSITESYSPTIRVRSATPEYDIKNWLLPHLAGRFHNHSQPHWFKFSKLDGHAVMHYKLWSKDEWLPRVEYGADGQVVERLDSLGLKCLKVIYLYS